MKKISLTLILCLILFSKIFGHYSSKPIVADNISLSTKTYKDNNAYFIVAEIGSMVLPYVAKEICIEILGKENQKICDAISDGLDFALGAASVRSKSFALGKLAGELVVSKYSDKSVFRFTTGSLELAYNIKCTLEAYESLSNVLWSSKQNNLPKKSYQYSDVITFENHSYYDIKYELSANNTGWRDIVFKQRSSRPITYYFQNPNENFIYLRTGDECNYQVFTGKTYIINKSPNLETYITVKQ